MQGEAPLLLPSGAAGEEHTGKGKAGGLAELYTCVSLVTYGGGYL